MVVFSLPTGLIPAYPLSPLHNKLFTKLKKEAPLEADSPMRIIEEPIPSGRAAFHRTVPLPPFLLFQIGAR